MVRCSRIPVAASLVAVALAQLTPRHEPGRCAFRGHCGSKSFFGKQLPCVDNDHAADPDPELRAILVDLCGAKWNDGLVCCDMDQVKSLKSELSTPNQIVSSCPACKENFFNLFCTFTCSPDQSLFVNVTQSMEKKGKTLVTEVDQLVSTQYGAGFYDSCKDVKFGPSNAKAMNFIGGGAENYTQLLKFLGDEKPIGSPFQINFPTNYPEPHMRPLEMRPKRCDDDDPNFRCACVDCLAVCPELPMLEDAGTCHVGLLPCLSFAAIFTYAMLLLLCLAAIVGHIAWLRHAKRRSERLRLLTESAAPSDDEDEIDSGQRAAMSAQRGYVINTWCDKAFNKLGHMAARFPAITIISSSLVVVVLSLGWIRFNVEKNPARLWVSPSSAAAEEKAFFDSNFGPFYRAEKSFLVNDSSSPGSGPGPVLSYDTLIWWMEVEREVSQLTSPRFGASLDDVCFKPTGSACAILSVSGYFSNDPAMVKPSTWRSRLEACAKSPVECRPEYGQPLDPNTILGSYSDVEHVADALAITTTWVVNNFPEDSAELARAMDWERALRDRLLRAQHEATQRGLRLSFSTEISLEEELNRSTNTDAKIVVISYIVMFLYASIALGSTSLSLRDLLRHPAVSLVESKFTLGVAGILIVLMSVTASIGLFSWAGLKATLIIVDVIPFIVLAVGVDNIFLIVHEFERVNVSHPDDMVEVRIAMALGRMGPSILFSALTETICFALGTFVGMPAVRNFAIYAAGAVFVNALLQVTMFVSVLTLNQIRVEDCRMDCLPCVPVKAARVHLSESHRGDGGNSSGQATRHFEISEETCLASFIRKQYAPRLLGKKTKTGVLLIFVGVFAAGIALIPEVKLGLDQRVAIPDDSYLISYFNDLYDYSDSGPPVYFVTKEVNATAREHQLEICARFPTCQQWSLPNILEQERKRPEVSYISSPTASWIDDFFLWLNPEMEQCCVEGREPCFEHREPRWNITLAGMPEGPEFIHYLDKFVHSPTDADCPLGGQASYGSALVLDSTQTTVRASHFRTTHTPLRSQDDFIKAYASARRIAHDISASTGLDVFPYSVFYIFFDQYASIVSLATVLIGSAVALIFVISTILLGSFLTAAVVSLTVTMIVIDILGAMAVMNVSLNAVSLVNLIICVGIAVEFCAHVARAFMVPPRTLLENAAGRFRARADARVWAALSHVGGSVISGITLTKLLGVIVLAFTRSKIFEIYYFRIWVALIIFASTHALIFLPVALSFIPGEPYLDPESEGGLEQDLASRRHRALLPDDSDSDSDDY